ncbi:MAG: ABC transporter permease [Alphaproteobacteria bacterium]|nr:ABC transporter permease [Alphaproteobacteria bacterium]
MLRGYFLRRSLSALVTLLGVSVLIFALARVIPGDPARTALGDAATNEQIEAYRAQLRLDDPLPVQYLTYVRGVLRGDLGISLYSGGRVAEDLARTLPATLELVLCAAVLMIGIGIPLGVLSGRYRDGAIDNVSRVVSLLGVVTPGFVWAIFLMLVFAHLLQVLPAIGRLSEGVSPPPAVTSLYLVDSILAGQWATFRDALAHVALPATALSLASIGQTARMTRANVAESYDRPYVEFARAYGFPERRIASRYALRPALIPVLTVLGLDIAIKFGGAFLIETVFSWPGMARYGVQVIQFKDLNAIVGTVMVIGFFFIFINLAVDLLVALIDPRIRLGARGQ